MTSPIGSSAVSLQELLFHYSAPRSDSPCALHRVWSVLQDGQPSSFNIKNPCLPSPISLYPAPKPPPPSPPGTNIPHRRVTRGRRPRAVIAYLGCHAVPVHPRSPRSSVGSTSIWLPATRDLLAVLASTPQFIRTAVPNHSHPLPLVVVHYLRPTTEPWTNRRIDHRIRS